MKMRLTSVAILTSLVYIGCASAPPPKDTSSSDRQQKILEQALKEHEQWKKQQGDKYNQPLSRSTPISHPPQPEYARIGITSDQLKKLCGTRYVDYGSTTTARGTVRSFTYKYNEDTSDKGCFGTFVFNEDDKLTMINRS